MSDSIASLETFDVFIGVLSKVILRSAQEIVIEPVECLSFSKDGVIDFTLIPKVV